MRRPNHLKKRRPEAPGFRGALASGGAGSVGADQPELDGGVEQRRDGVAAHARGPGQLLARASRARADVVRDGDDVATG